MKRISLIALTLPLILGSGTAMATTFDFGALADQLRAQNGGRELTWAEAFPGGGWEVDGITVTASGRGHLDGGFNSRGFQSAPSGLGHCDIDDCNADDADGIREASDRLDIMFSQVVSVVWTIRETTEAWRRGEQPDHTLADGCARVNGTDYDLSGGAFSADLGRSASWTFEACEAGSSFGVSDYYVTAAEIVPAPIPVPAGALLLGSALLGLGLRARLRG